MSRTNKKKKILISDVTLERWLELMEKRPKNVDFYHFRFPTDEIRDQFLANIFNYSEKTITEILNSFLDLGASLASDQSSLNHLEHLMENDPEEAKRLINEVPYYRRLLAHVISRGKTPLREGITWIMDLLPSSPREALDALEAYLHVHLLYLPDGRIHGLSDAMAILRTRYFSTDETVANSILFSLKPIDFEHLAESLYVAMGYLTEMTKPSHDGGRDIIATKNEPGKKEKILIQCKRWQNVVGVEDVRALLGVVTHEKATKGTLITTSHFSPDANTFANENPSIELISLKPLQHLLSEHLGQFWITHTDHLLRTSKNRHPLDQRK
jgi:restriction system protein